MGNYTKTQTKNDATRILSRFSIRPIISLLHLKQKQQQSASATYYIYSAATCSFLYPSTTTTMNSAISPDNAASCPTAGDAAAEAHAHNNNVPPNTNTTLRTFVCRIENMNYTKTCVLDPRKTPTMEEFQRKVAKKFGVDLGGEDNDDNRPLLKLYLDGEHLVEDIEEICAGDKLALKVTTRSEHPDYMTNHSDGNPLVAMPQAPSNRAQFCGPSNPLTTLGTTRGAPQATTNASSNNQEEEKKEPEKGQEQMAKAPSSKKLANKSGSKKSPLQRGKRRMTEAASLFDAWHLPSRSSNSTVKSTRSSFCLQRQAKAKAITSLKEENLARKPFPKKAPHVTQKKRKATSDSKEPANLKPATALKMPKQEVIDVDDPYAVGMSFFVEHVDGNEYPVRIMPQLDTDILREDQRRINWIGYQDESIVNVKDLIPSTSEREAYFWDVVAHQLQQNKEAETDSDYSSGEEEDRLDEMERRQEELLTEARTRRAQTVQPTKTQQKSISATTEGDQDKNENQTYHPMSFEVGGKFFLKHSSRNGDEVEYPVEIVRFCTKSVSENRCVVHFIGYHNRSDKTVNMTDLLPYTREKEKIYQARLSFTKQKRVSEMARKKQSKGKNRSKRRSNFNPQKEGEQQKRVKLEEEKSKEEPKKKEQDVLYGPPTDVSDLPTRDDESKLPPGTAWMSGKRWIYITKIAEQPSAIAKKFGLPKEKLLYDNRQVWGKKLTASSRFQRGTPVVLPLEWKGSKVQLRNNSQA